MSLKRSVDMVNSLRFHTNNIKKERTFGAALLVAFIDIESINLKDERLRLLHQSATDILHVDRIDSDRRSENTITISKEGLEHLVASTESAGEFLALVACMAIVAPQSETMWSDIDKRIVATAESFSLDQITLTTLIVASVASRLKFQNNQLTSGRTAAMLLLKNLDKLLFYGEPMINLNDSEQLRAISYLGFRMQLICRYCGYTKSTVVSSDLNKLMSYSTALMSVITIDVPLQYLEPIWCSTALFKSTQSIIFSNYLQRLIKKSINGNLSQMKGREKSVLALLRFMKVTKTIDRPLLTELMNFCDTSDFNNTKYGTILADELLYSMSK